ncbi:MAG TPA: ketoacyl-ACP synthase III [Bacteroidales bacterium]|nr:ketoacyl-ACP synthase III [Bacteroidales bacterium]HQN17013.1 ketoacyl-ACP synthase III [Bacteroidales bacterium]
MAFSRTKHVKVAGIAACVPKNIVENSAYPLFVNDEYDKFVASVGIERRRIVEPGVCTSDLCYAAADKIVQDLGWNREEIDLLVFVSHTADYKLPATSCILQQRLGLSRDCMTLDITLGCSGYIHGLNVAASLMAAGTIKKCLLLAGNTQSLYASYEDKSAYPLFADGGTATALEWDEQADDMFFHFGTDGSGYQAIILPDGGCRNPVTPDSFRMEDIEGGNRCSRLHERLDGMEVFSFGITRAPQSVNKLIENFNLNIETPDYFLFHQANRFMVEKIRKKLKLPEEKVPYNIKDFGNTSCATIPLLMVTNLKEQLENKKLQLLLCGFGVGLSWGSAVLSTDKCRVSDLVEI